jgi:type II secretory pathway pseudopilin PulG
MTTHYDDMSEFDDQPSKPKKSRRKFGLVELLAVLGIIALLIAFLFPDLRSVRPAARRALCVINLEQIASALRHYESTYKALPPAYTVDANGKPLHSWRALILPYLEQQSLYEAIDLSKPWNDPANAKVYAEMIPQFRCRDLDLPATKTTYLAMGEPNGCFLRNKPRHLSEITDDLGLTLMVIEAPRDRAVHWMAPVDADESLVMGISPQSKLNHTGGMNALFVNGVVRFVTADIPAAQRRAIISTAGNDNDAARGLD